MKKVLVIILAFCFIFCACQNEPEDPNWTLPYTLIWNGETYANYEAVSKADFSEYTVGKVTARVDHPKENGESNCAEEGARIADFYGRILLETAKGWYIMSFADEGKTFPELPKILNHKDEFYFWTGETVDYAPAEGETLNECWSLVDGNAVPAEWGETNFPNIHKCEYILNGEDVFILVDDIWYLMEG